MAVRPSSLFEGCEPWPIFLKEKEGANEAHERKTARRMDAARIGLDCIGLWAGSRSAGKHDDHTGHGLPGKWTTWVRDADLELAGLHDSERPGGCRGLNERGNRAERCAERESRAKCGSDTGRPFL